MKTLLLIITIWLLIQRIRSTPRNISKSRYDTYINKIIKSEQQILSHYTSHDIDVYKIIKTILYVSLYTIMFAYYLYLANKFESVMFVYILSIIQCSSVLITLYQELKTDIYNIDKNTYEFNRWWLLFNVILDYVYYSAVIYLLLQ
jgi:hypothetical protein